MATFQIKDKETGEVFTVKEKSPVVKSIESQRTPYGPLTLAGAVVPTNAQEAMDIARVGLGAVASPSMLRNPFNGGFTVAGIGKGSGVDQMVGQAENALQPKTKFGEQLKAGTDVGLVAGGIASMLPSKVGNMADLVKTAQKAFWDYQKKGTTEFGQALRAGRKSGTVPSVYGGEAEAALSPISGAEEFIAKQIPSKAKLAASNSNNIKTVEDLLRTKSQLRRSMSMAERDGTLTTERSRVIKDSIKNIDSLVKSKVPNMDQANANYSVYSRVKEILGKIEPKFARMQTPFGTAEGEKYLRKVLQFTDEEIASFKELEKISGKNIIGKAKTMVRTERAVHLLGKMVAIGAAIAGAKKLGADKAFFNTIDASN